MFEREQEDAQRMDPQKLVEPFPLRLPGILDSAFLAQGSPARRRPIELIGSGNWLSLAPVLSQQAHPVIADRPHLVILSTEEAGQEFIEGLHFFDPSVEAYLLPAFDVSLYSGLYPNHRKISRRMQWLFHAQTAKPGQVFVASMASIIQKTLPFTKLSQSAHAFSVNDEIPADLPEFLNSLGYSATPIVEDVGTYSVRGGIVDIYSPAQHQPVRLELFGDLIESIRLFDPETQHSEAELKVFHIIPPREVLYSDENRQIIAKSLKQSAADREVPKEEIQPILHQVAQGQYFNCCDFFLPLFYDSLDEPMTHFSSPLNIWNLDPNNLNQDFDIFWAELKSECEASKGAALLPDYKALYKSFDQLTLPIESREIMVSRIKMSGPELVEEDEQGLEYRSTEPKEFSATTAKLSTDPEALAKYIEGRLTEWKQRGLRIFISTQTQNQAQRLRLLLEKAEFKPSIIDENNFNWQQLCDQQAAHIKLIHIVPRPLGQSLRFSEESLCLLRDSDFFGRKGRARQYKSKGSLQERAQVLSFRDLNPGDLVVHKLHGVGLYQGLKSMPIQGIAAEFVQLEYKGKDKLYLPVYRIGQIQKFSGPSGTRILDKLGGTGWEKTKTKVKNKLRDLASELLKLYAIRAQVTRPPFPANDNDFESFENGFAFTETEDQLKTIESVLKDMRQEKPMDRLVCGDVGFGKTEIAMRAAFLAIQGQKQVAILAPTTILTFQHFENFKKRFNGWPISIKTLNRFVPSKEIKETLEAMSKGKVDLVIGTHRLLSRDVHFDDLGLLIIDEEQKFGVKHKERIRQLKASVDTLALSATPIPRTLNMSLMGLRDLSIINTPPLDRLPTRTFVCKADDQMIRKAVVSEIDRGGQVFFIHNRVQSILNLAADLREILPSKVRIVVAHGQMPDGQLEKAMVAFLNHEYDLLLCTTIIESGMDIPRANTMFIDDAHKFGLSQLYQLRGRVGRSKERAYCYLLVPSNRRLDADQQERLKVIQDNTALGSGIRIAQHDLELRGSGDLLGGDQSGHINAVGYELFLELLDEAVQEEKGEPKKEADIEPEINLKVAALIPDTYISDIRMRLSYYKALADIQDASDIDRIEDELRDQFGKLPESVLNLMGIMLIRKYCKDLGIKDIRTGKGLLSLAFTERTPLSTEKVIELTARANKKYSITPDNRLNVRMKEVLWPRVYDELVYLKGL